MMQSVDCNTDNDVYQADNDGPKMHPLPNNVLNASELYSIVTSDKPTFTSIPMGQKNNCYMLLDNSTNVERKKSNKNLSSATTLDPGIPIRELPSIPTTLLVMTLNAHT